MNSNRSKTQKRSGATDLSGSNFAANLHASTNVFVNFLNQEAGDAYKRPWHRLERGLRLNRLRRFIDEEALRLTLTPPEKVSLESQIMKANEKKLLNSKNAVIYDQEEQKIKEIKGLVMHRGADGKVLFQVLEKRNAVTFRKKAATPTPETVPAVADQGAAV
jgi:hypothetical protein